MSGLRESLERVGRPDVIVVLGYGFELPVFSRARALWDFYLSHFPNLTYFVCRATNELGHGEVVHDGHDLLIGSDPRTHRKGSGEAGYASSGVWSSAENLSQVSFQFAIYDYLLRRYDKPFYVCHSTITSVVDFRLLFALVDSLSSAGVFAGMPARITTPGDYENLSVVCGTNCLFTRDMVELMLERFDPHSPHNGIPQDVNVSYMLRDIARTPLPFFSFIKPRDPATGLGNVGAITRRMLDTGHYQFRVKTTSEQAQLGRREDVDPWIMLEIMRAILGYEPNPAAAVDLRARLLKSLGTRSGVSMAAYEDHFFSGPRDFPLTDEEAEAIHPDLRAGASPQVHP
jgi:hypothetical protein